MSSTASHLSFGAALGAQVGAESQPCSCVAWGVLLEGLERPFWSVLKLGCKNVSKTNATVPGYIWHWKQGSGLQMRPFCCSVCVESHVKCQSTVSPQAMHHVRVDKPGGCLTEISSMVR